MNTAKTAHYFLLVSALDTADLVGRSENARALMIAIQSAMGIEMFSPGQSNTMQEIVQKINTFYRPDPAKESIPEVIDSVNLFVHETAKGNLVKYAEQFAEPEDMVKEIARNIQFMGGQHIDHAWMYLRWMVCSHPDLHIFSNFFCKNLQIPLTSFVRNVAFCLGLCSSMVPDWSDPRGIEKD